MPRNFATLFSEFAVILPHHFSLVTTASQLSQTISAPVNFATLFNSSQSCSTSPFLSSTLPNHPHLCTPPLHSSQLFSTRLNSHLRSTHHTFFSAHLKSSHLLSSGQLFSTLFTSRHTEQVFKLRSFYTQQTFAQRNFYTQNVFTQSNPYTKQAVAQRIFFTKQAFAKIKY